ncbi:MAG: T9SS type A sorting domain-containing protein [Phycisphaerae bacterium]|nr:T9SS type A sorting domain-containing protein [Saprospiraceae bacterium]
MKRSLFLSDPRAMLAQLTTLGVFIFYLIGLASASAQCPTGGLQLTSQAQVNNFTSDYPGCTVLPGGLEIGPSSDITDLSPLASIQSIVGILHVDSNTALSSVNLTGLTSVHSVNIYQNPMLQTISLSGLTAVTMGDFNIHHNPHLHTVHAPPAVTQFTSMQLYSNPLLATLTGMTGLTQVDNSLIIETTNLTSLALLGNVVSVGSLYIEYNPFLTDTGLVDLLDADLTNMGSAFVDHNALITELDFSAVANTVMGVFYVHTNPLLHTVHAPPAVTQFTGDMEIFANPALAVLTGMTNLTQVGNHFYVGNTLLTSLSNFQNLVSAGGFFAIESNPNLPSLAPLGNVVSVGDRLFIINNPILTDTGLVDLLDADLTNVGGAYVGQNALITELDFSAIANTTMSDFLIYGNPLLHTVHAPPAVTQFTGSMQIYSNPFLATLTGMTNLTQVGAYLNIRNTNLTSLALLGNVVSVGSLFIEYNPFLTDTGLVDLLDADLTNVGDVYVIFNNLLTELDFSAIANTTMGDFQISGNPLLHTVHAPPAVTQITGAMVLSVMPLTNLTGMTGLTQVGANFLVYETLFSSLPNFQNLVSVGGHLYIYGNTNLSCFPTFNSLTTVGGDLTITANPQLSYCSTASICDLTVGGLKYVSGNAIGCNSTAEIDAFCIEPPTMTITCPANQTTNADPGSCVHTVVGAEFDPTSFTDYCYASTMYTLTGATIGNGLTTLAGTVFQPGITTVQWTVTGANNNTGTCSFAVTVTGATEICGDCSTDNLLTNPGFENGPAGWVFNDAKIQNNSTQAHNGQKSARICGNDGKGKQKVVATPGTVYTLSVWARENGGGAKKKIKLRFFDAANNLISQKKQTVNGNSWTLYTLSNVAPPGTVWVKVVFTKNDSEDNEANCGGCLYVDDCCLLQSPSQQQLPPVFVVLNGSERYSETQKENYFSPEIFTLFPNPAKDELFVLGHQNGANEDFSFVVTDFLGKEIREVKGKFEADNPFKISLDGLANGTYCLQIRGNGIRSVTRKFVVVR